MREHKILINDPLIYTGSPMTLGLISAAHSSPVYVSPRGEKGKRGLLPRTAADDQAYNDSSARKGRKDRLLLY